VSARWGTVTSILICFLFISCAGYFASYQAIWVDETTQLSGLSLPLDIQLRWLLGKTDLQLGVPADRMPPLSYWAGSFWAAIFGLSETTMRWFGVFATLLAAPALYLSGTMRGGTWGGLFVLTLVLLSPNTLIIAGEIRAYPLFLSLSAWSVWAFLRCVDPKSGTQTRRLVTLTILLLLTAYTHFFGIVFAGLLFISLLIERIWSGRGVGQLLSAGICGTVALVGVIPFVVWSLNFSGGGDVANNPPLAEVAVAWTRLLFRVFLHGCMGVYPFILGAACLSILGIASLAVFREIRMRPPASGSWQGLFLLLPLLIAFFVLPILDFWIASFAVLSNNYNLWMVPLAAVFISGAFACDQDNVVYQRCAKAFGLVLVASLLIGDAVLLRHAPLYSHSASEWLADIWETERPIIIHEGSGKWGSAYFGLHYLSDGKAIQLLAQNDGTMWRIRPDGLVLIDDPVRYLWASDKTLHVLSFNLRNKDLSRLIRSEAHCGPDLESWDQRTDVRSYCAYNSSFVATYQAQGQ